MRTALTSLIAIFVLATPALAYDPYPFQRSDGKWGYVDDEHCWVIAPNFDHARLFSEGLAPVQIGRVWGYINTSGQLVVSPQFKAAYEFSEGKAAILDDNGTYFIDPSGDRLFEVRSQFDFGRPNAFSDGRSMVRVGDKAGFIDHSGRIVIPAQFDDAFMSGFAEGLAPVKLGEKWGYIDINGQMAINPIFDDASQFSEGLAAIQINAAKGFIDHSARVRIATVFYGSGMSFREGLAPVLDKRNGGKWGFINSDGEYIIPPTYDLAQVFSEGLAAVSVENTFGFINKSGAWAIDPQFSLVVSNFSNGRAEVSLGNRLRIIDRTGNVLLDPTCDHTG